MTRVKNRHAFGPLAKSSALGKRCVSGTKTSLNVMCALSTCQKCQSESRGTCHLLLHLAHGDFVLDLCSCEPWGAALDDETIDFFGGAIYSPDDDHVCVRAVADPPLLTAQHPAGLALSAAHQLIPRFDTCHLHSRGHVRRRCQLQIGRVTAGIGLGQAKTANQLQAGQFRQVLLFLLFTSYFSSALGSVIDTCHSGTRTALVDREHGNVVQNAAECRETHAVPRQIPIVFPN